MMGAWFMADSIGNYVGGRVASTFESSPLPRTFGEVALACIVLAAILLVLIRPMRRLSH
jgi:dipeptide/tripeptide permease